eukprot:2808243-Rhodomonas_salina.1
MSCYKREKNDKSLHMTSRLKCRTVMPKVKTTRRLCSDLPPPKVTRSRANQSFSNRHIVAPNKSHLSPSKVTS